MKILRPEWAYSGKLGRPPQSPPKYDASASIWPGISCMAVWFIGP
jgi:hypothetical protein